LTRELIELYQLYCQALERIATANSMHDQLKRAVERTGMHQIPEGILDVCEQLYKEGSASQVNPDKYLDRINALQDKMDVLRTVELLLPENPRQQRKKGGSETSPHTRMMRKDNSGISLKNNSHTNSNSVIQ